MDIKNGINKSDGDIVLPIVVIDCTPETNYECKKNTHGYEECLGVRESCLCCGGTGYCEGEHYDDLGSCMTCGGSGG